MVQPLWNKVQWFLKKIKIDLPYDLAILLLRMYPKEVKARTLKDICTPIFTAALFTVGKRWKQPKCPLTDEQINEMWYLHQMGY